MSFPVQAGLLELLFPSYKKDKAEDIYETLRAPFADEVPEEEKEKQKTYTTREEVMSVRLPENSVPLEKPHRQDSYISEYVGEMVAQAMTFDGGDYKVSLTDNEKLFDANGKAQYKAFLEEINILKILQAGHLKIRGFLLDTPLLLNEGAVEGRYRWLYEVPVMVSYMNAQAVDYKEQDATNQKVVVRLQVGRHKGLESDTGILIETWSGKLRKAN